MPIGENSVDVDEIIVRGDVIVNESVEVVGGLAFTSLPAGTKMIFCGIGGINASLPTGWAKDTAGQLNNALIRVTTGAISYGGSEHVANHEHTYDHAHSIPSHTHTWSLGNHLHAPIAVTAVKANSNGSYLAGLNTSGPLFVSGSGATTSAASGNTGVWVANSGAPHDDEINPGDRAFRSIFYCLSMVGVKQ